MGGKMDLLQEAMPGNVRRAWFGSLIERAVLAPSSHNTQPWFFRMREASIELFADRTRALPVNDPDDRELTISCGCALMNLRIAAACDGWDARVELLPEADDADLLARVSFPRRADPAGPDAGLEECIRQRRTYRKRFARHAVEATLSARLSAAATREGAWLRALVTEDARAAAAGMVSEGDAAQWANPSWRRELAAWMHPRRDGDGFGIPRLAVPLAQLLVRSFDMGGGVAAKDKELAEGSPLLAVLGTDGDDVRDWLIAGQALQRVLLLGCQHGLQASYLNQAIQLPFLRTRLHALAAAGFPQILLRLGYPVDAPAPVPRRPTAAVIVREAAGPDAADAARSGSKGND